MPARVFDAYGTLFDVNSAVLRNAEAVGPDAVRLADLWRTKQLEYTWVLNGIGLYEDFDVLTRRALDFALATLGLENATLRALLLDSYAELAAYPDAAEALRRIKAKGDRVVVFSNATPAMLDRALSSSGLAALVDEAVSVDHLHRFKPLPAVYGLLDRWRGDLVFHSSNRWDIAGAVACGLKAIWINRRKQAGEYPGLEPCAEVPDLIAAVQAVCAA
jgi:2-haloacid dehalogenase